MKRFALHTTPSPDLEGSYWWAAGARHEGAIDDLLALIGQMNGDFVKESRTYFPEPFKPLAREDFKAIDEASVLTRIRDRFPAGAARHVLESFWTLNCNGPLENAALTPGPPLGGTDQWRLGNQLRSCATYKILNGTAALAVAILAGSKATVEYGFAVELFRIIPRPWTSAGWTGVPSTRALRSSLFRCTP